MARTRGARGKKTEANRQTILEEIKVRGKQTPLEFLLKVMWSAKRYKLEARIDAAKAAAPYVHRKMPLEIENSGEVTIIPPFVPSRGELAKDFEHEGDE